MPIDSVLIALVDPSRRRILELLADRERSVGELVARFTLTQPAVSGHLRVLREAGLVDVRADGARRVYSLRRGRLDELVAWLERLA